MKRLESVLQFLCRAVIAGAFWLATRISNEVKVQGRQYDSGAARTYLGMSHKRDLDPLVLLPTLIFHHGWRRLAGELHFALRGDAFSPGYLGRMVMRPRWLSRCLRVLSIGKVLRWLGAHSADALVRPAEEWIYDVLLSGEDRPASEVLAPAILQELAQASGESLDTIAATRLSRLLTWRYHTALQPFHGAEVLREPYRRISKQHMVTRIKSELVELDDWLWQGGSLYGSAEGQLSPDGKLGSINTAFHRLMRAAPPDTRVVPISLVYDFMTTQRLRIFIDFAPAIEHASTLALDELDAVLREGWIQQARFTCTQLASGYLAQMSQRDGSAFTVDDLAKGIHVQAKQLLADGRHVDAYLLTMRGARKRAKGYLNYARHHALVRRVDRLTYVPSVAEPPLVLRPREVSYDLAPFTYACNELQDMLDVGLHKLLPCDIL